MFALTVQGGMCTSSVPDVCKTPAPPGPPTPVPYVNIFQCNMVLPNTASTKVFICGAAALNVKSKTTISNGDEPGVAGGVSSGKFIGPGEFTKGSAKVQFQGKDAVKMGASTKHNDGNATGMSSTSAQTKVSLGG